MTFNSLGQYLFCSVTNNSNSSTGYTVGSIYFANGRIRLAHNGGPAIERYEKLIRAVVEDADEEYIRSILKKTKTWSDASALLCGANNDKKISRYNIVIISMNPSFNMASYNAKTFSKPCVFELLNRTDDADINFECASHTSRGFPKRINITDVYLQNIFNKIEPLLKGYKHVTGYYADQYIMPSSKINAVNAELVEYLADERNGLGCLGYAPSYSFRRKRGLDSPSDLEEKKKFRPVTRGGG